MDQPRAAVDGARGQRKIGAVAYEEGIRPQKPSSGAAQLPALPGALQGRLVREEITLPERVGKELLRDGLDENPVVDLDLVRPGVPGYGDVASAHDLLRQGRDVGAVLLAREPQARREPVKVPG